jgi:hypothetical protein
VLLRVSFLIVTIGGFQAAGAEGLRCTDAKGQKAPGICGQFERAPRADPADPSVVRALAVWQRVRGPFTALTGRDTGINVLAREARYDAAGKKTEFPPAAYICPGGPPIVYVPYTLLERVYEKQSYGENFLAFVFGHELGHRMNDITIDGCQLAAFQRPGKGRAEEELADARGAFFAAVGGFSTRSLARDDHVSHFLKAEFDVGRRGAQKRRDALLGALHHFDAYENLYEISMSLLFGGEVETAARLLSWADELIAGHGVPLPELKVIRALALTMSVAPRAPAFRPAGFQADIAQMRCKPVFPAHTGLWEKPDRRRVRRGAEKPEAILQRAKRLLDDAAALGANDLVVASGLACIAIYSGDIPTAIRHLKSAKRLAGRANSEVHQALAANEALANFVAFLNDNPLPDTRDKSAGRSFGKKLKRLKKRMKANPEVSELIRRFASYPKILALPKASRPSCGGGEAGFVLGRPPAMPTDVGQCPTGWTLAHSVPTADAGASSGTTSGVTTCESTSTPGVTLSRIRLPGSMSPTLDEVEMTVRTVRRLPAAARDMKRWQCGCTSLESKGVSDLGDGAVMAKCKKVGLFSGVLFTGKRGQVTRAASFHF